MNDGNVPEIGQGEDRIVGRFAVLLEDCREILALLSEAVDDHLGLSPEEVAWGNVADADRLLGFLRQAAFAARVQEETKSYAYDPPLPERCL